MIRERVRAWATPVRIAEAVGVALVMFVVLWELHPSLVFSSSLITGGDTASHLALPAYLRTQGNLFNLTPWYPGWFDGMPAYTYYFVLPDFLATLGSYVIGFAHAFKLATIAGSMLMPAGAYLLGRLFRAPRPVPLGLAMATLPFLFDASYTIDGGNLFSTMAGEYAFSFSLALALVTIGLFARGVRTGRGYWLAGVSLSLTLAAHVLPWLFTLLAVGVLVVFEVLQRRGHGDPRDRDVMGDPARPVRFAVGAGLISFGLSAWWLLSFISTQNLTNSMGYTNVDVSTLHSIFTSLGWFTSTGGAGGDRWVIVLALLAAVVAFVVRDRLGMVLATLTALSFTIFVFDPQSVIWNERLIPFWYVFTHLAVGWLAGYLLSRWVAAAEGGDSRRQGFYLYVRGGAVTYSRVPLHEATPEIAPLAADVDVDEGDDPGVGDPLDGEDAGEVVPATPTASSEPAWAHWRAPKDAAREGDSRRLYRATIAVIVLGLASTVPGLLPPVASALGLTTSGNQVSGWAQFNYSGYQGKAAWPEYHNLMDTMAAVGRRWGCGRAMWEYNSDQNRFGSPMALMLLPYWTNNCIDSMEGLFFESSATTPYHFLDQAELSVSPSNPQVGLPYGQLDVKFGVEHLQMLGVRYFTAFSPSVIAQADADPSLVRVASTKAWPSPGDTWRVYRVLDSPVVQPLANWPNVVGGISSRVGWLNANVTWWLNPKLWAVPAAESGPTSWPRASSITSMRTRRVADPARVSHVRVGTQSVSFDVNRVGTPILVKVSYYPRWHVSGATGPYRVSPNLMVVVPTSRHVVLTYSSSPPLLAGNLVSDVTSVAGLAVLGVALKRRRDAPR